MNIPIELLVGIIGVIVSIIGYFIKKEIKTLSEGLDLLMEKKNNITDRITVLETNYYNIDASLHEFGVLLEKTQEMVIELRQSIAVLQTKLEKK